MWIRSIASNIQTTSLVRPKANPAAVLVGAKARKARKASQVLRDPKVPRVLRDPRVPIVPRVLLSQALRLGHQVRYRRNHQKQIKLQVHRPRPQRASHHQLKRLTRRKLCLPLRRLLLEPIWSPTSLQLLVLQAVALVVVVVHQPLCPHPGQIRQVRRLRLVNLCSSPSRRRTFLNYKIFILLLCHFDILKISF